MKNPRLLLALGVLVVVLAAGVVLLSSHGQTSPGPHTQRLDASRRRPLLPVARAALTLQEFDRSDTGNELLISLRKTRLNTLRTTGGQRSVSLTCFSARGAQAFSVRQAWPLMEEFGYPFAHIHVPVGRRLLATIRRCRLTGPGIDFDGRVPGRLPRVK